MATQYMIRAEMEYKKCFTTYIHRPGAADLLQWMCAQGFFEAPASMKHHGAEPGGLARHSINVFERLATPDSRTEDGVKPQSRKH